MKKKTLVAGERRNLIQSHCNFDIFYSHLRYFINSKRPSGYLWDFSEDSHIDGESFFSTPVFLWLLFSYIALVSILGAMLNSSVMLLVCLSEVSGITEDIKEFSTTYIFGKLGKS